MLIFDLSKSIMSREKAACGCDYLFNYFLDFFFLDF